MPERVRAAIARTYQCDPEVEVILERRSQDRRGPAERRMNPWDPMVPRQNRLERRAVRDVAPSAQVVADLDALARELHPGGRATERHAWVE